MIKILSFLILFCSTIQLLAQSNCREGLAFTFYKHVPERNDSLAFAFYPNGKAKFYVNDFDTEYDFYLDSNDKNSAIDYFLLVSNSKYNNERDTAKYQYFYKGGFVDKVIVLERKCFKSNKGGGCIINDNKYSGFWRIVMKQFYENDEYGNIVKWTSYLDWGTGKDTTKYDYVYAFDKNFRIISKKDYKNDSLVLIQKYIYGKKYSKIQKFPSFHHGSVPWLEEELFYNMDSLLIRKVESGQYYDTRKFEYIYSYTKNGFPLKELKYSLGENEPFIIKEYKYSICD